MEVYWDWHYTRENTFPLSNQVEARPLQPSDSSPSETLEKLYSCAVEDYSQQKAKQNKQTTTRNNPKDHQ